MRQYGGVWLMVLCMVMAWAHPCRSEGGGRMALTVRSEAFENGATVPAEYTCDGHDISPPLTWSGAPHGTVSYALIADDPDAPMGTWVHWVMFNIPATVTSLAPAVPPDLQLADGSYQGMTDFGRVGYGGPAPPRGVHRYYFRVYALDTMLVLTSRATKRDVVAAMQGHVLAEGVLYGTYERTKKR